MTAPARASLIDRLPPVRGRMVANAPLAPLTWFRVGGAAEALFQPADVDDLCAFMAARPRDVAVTAIGVGSNLLVRDGGVAGVVIRLGRAFGEISCAGTRVTAGAAAPDRRVALQAARAGIDGLSFFTGIPGAIGGALAMNAGCYGRETCDALQSCDVVTDDGARATLTVAELNPGYRHGGLPPGSVAVAATFAGAAGDPAAIQAAMAEVTARREASQPIRERTGGSTFRNPPDARAWEVIDAAGARGLRVGTAHMSEKHCNFMIADRDARAADLEALGETVRRRVRAHSGHELVWEIRRIGVPAPGSPPPDAAAGEGGIAEGAADAEGAANAEGAADAEGAANAAVGKEAP